MQEEESTRSKQATLQQLFVLSCGGDAALSLFRLVFLRDSHQPLPSFFYPPRLSTLYGRSRHGVTFQDEITTRGFWIFFSLRESLFLEKKNLLVFFLRRKKLFVRMTLARVSKALCNSNIGNWETWSNGDLTFFNLIFNYFYLYWAETVNESILVAIFKNQILCAKVDIH